MTTLLSLEIFGRARYHDRKFPKFSLRNPSKDRQRVVDAIILISAPDWSKTLKLSLKRNTKSAFERRTMLGFAKLNCDRHPLAESSISTTM